MLRQAYDPYWDAETSAVGMLCNYFLMFLIATLLMMDSLDEEQKEMYSFVLR